MRAGRAGARRRAGLAAIALLVLAATLAPTASAATDTARDRFALGDSVMLGAAAALRAAGFRVDATESRQAYSGPAMLRKRGRSLPQNVVVHLGTNGTFPLSTCQALVRAAGPDRRVFLVTVHARRSWARSNNAVIRTCARGFARDRVHVVDWHKAAADHPSWLYSDGIHLKPAGAAGFARLLDDAVDHAIEVARRAALASAHGSGVAALES